MTKIKICGITCVDDAVAAVKAGADFIGINFWPSSKRFVEIERAAELARAVRGAAQIVGVFVDARGEHIGEVVEHVGLDIVQLHGDESRADVTAVASATKRPVWKAVAVRGEADVDAVGEWPADAILLDTPTPGRGGSGVTFDWSLARAARERFPARSLVLAGGLSPENVARAVAEVAPFAVDVASGVETAPGQKSVLRMTAFVAAVRGGS